MASDGLKRAAFTHCKFTPHDVLKTWPSYSTWLWVGLFEYFGYFVFGLVHRWRQCQHDDAIEFYNYIIIVLSAEAVAYN